MSTQKRGQYWVLEIGDSGSPETWRTVACLKSKGIDSNTKVIDGTSDCGPNYQPGFQTSTATAAGFYAFDDDTVDSGIELFDLQQNSTIKDWRITPVTPVIGDPTWTFVGFISSFKNTFNTDEMAAFDISWQVQGYVTQTIEA